MKHTIIGTAGHVDHGKTTLIRALTGVDTDRLPEEKARGMSIELGFAYFDLPDGTRCGIVDVPGHERFIDTMVSGAHGMDVVLFVVSAKEGAQRQTVEHLQILDLLDVRHGILVVTMSDLVDSEVLEFAIEETKEALEGTSLEGIPHVAVSGTTGDGIDELRALLVEVAGRVHDEESPDELPRLPIDRVFTLEGFGLVVTGTLRSGVLNANDRVHLLPGGRPARIRSLQVHGSSVARALPGQRTAVNLVGVEREFVERGDVLTVPELSMTTRNIDASVRVVADFPRIVEHWTRSRLHIGTREAFCRIVTLVDRDGILPGAASVVQLRVEEPISAVRGDRFILRDASAERTLGGGVVLDPSAPRHRRFADRTRAHIHALSATTRSELMEHLLRRGAPFVGLSTLVPYFPLRAAERDRWIRELSERGVVVSSGEALIAPERYGALRDAVLAELRAFHTKEPLELGVGVGALRATMPETTGERDFDWLIDSLQRAGSVVRDGSTVRLASHRVSFGDEDGATRDRLVELFREAGIASPSLSELEETLASVPANRVLRVIQTLVRLGTLTRIDEEYWLDTSVYTATLDALREHFADHPTIDIAGFRDLTGASRKYAVPFLEHCDARGYTVRAGNARRAKPTFLQRS